MTYSFGKTPIIYRFMKTATVLRDFIETTNLPLINIKNGRPGLEGRIAAS